MTGVSASHRSDPSVDPLYAMTPSNRPTTTLERAAGGHVNQAYDPSNTSLLPQIHGSSSNISANQSSASASGSASTGGEAIVRSSSGLGAPRPAPRRSESNGDELAITSQSTTATHDTIVEGEQNESSSAVEL